MNYDTLQAETDNSVYPHHRLFSKLFIRGYQEIFSPSKGGECPMHPHCSLYGMMAFERYHPLVAFMMTTDRLHRCGHDLAYYKLTEVDYKMRFFDPHQLSFVYDNDTPETTDDPIDEPSTNQVTESHNSELAAKSSNQDSLLYTFAQTLQMGGDLDRAITEYRRLLSYYPNSALRSDAQLSILDCYYLNTKYLETVNWGRVLLNQSLEDKASLRTKYLVGLSFTILGNYRRADEYFDELVQSGDENYDDRALILRGAVSSLRKEWLPAREYYNRIVDASPYSYQARYLDSLNTVGMNLKRKSPTLAGFLAIVPGLGYLYDGYPQTAISSFLVNSLFFWGTYQAYDNDNTGLGVLMTVLSFGWYSGNIFGSITSAKRRNLKLENDLIYQLEIGIFF